MMRHKNTILALILLSTFMVGCKTTGNKVEQSHDKFTGKNNVFIKQMNIGDSLYISFLSTKKHTNPRPLRSVILLISSRSKRWRFLKDNHLRFLADKSPIDLGKMQWDGDVEYGRRVIENMSNGVPINIFKVMVNARSLSGRIGQTEFSFTPSQMKIIREFASKIY